MFGFLRRTNPKQPNLTKFLEKRRASSKYEGFSRETNLKRRGVRDARPYRHVQGETSAASVKRKRIARKMDKLAKDLSRMQLGGRTQYAMNRLRTRDAPLLRLTYKRAPASARSVSAPPASVRSVSGSIRAVNVEGYNDPVMQNAYNNDDVNKYVREKSFRFIGLPGKVLLTPVEYLENVGKTKFGTAKHYFGSKCGPYRLNNNEKTFPETHMSKCCREGVGGTGMARKGRRKAGSEACASVAYDTNKKYKTTPIFDIYNDAVGEMQRIVLQKDNYDLLVKKTREKPHKYWELKPTDDFDYFHSDRAVRALNFHNQTLLGESHGRRVDGFAIYKLSRTTKNALLGSKRH